VAAPARSRRRAAGPVVQQPPSRASSELILAFAALELQLSEVAQQGLAGEQLDTVLGRRRVQRQSRLLIDTFRRDYRERLSDLLESAYGSGARLAGARPPGAIQRAAMARLVNGTSQRLDFALDTVGRQVDDIFRKAGLEHAARQLSRELPQEAAVDLMRRDLAERGVTGFIDKRGARWTLSNYARMALKTTASEAANRGVADAVKATGRDLVRVSSHHCKHHPSDPTNPCRVFEGRTLSLTGRTPGVPVLLSLPPWHPFCEHSIGPAAEGV
jgi:Phage minor capsid protein 2